VFRFMKRFSLHRLLLFIYLFIYFFFNGWVILNFLASQLRLEVVRVSRVGIKLGFVALKTYIVE
jgi:hypothetical protein